MTIDLAPDGTRQVTIDVPVTMRLARQKDLGVLSKMWGPVGMAERTRVLRRYFEEYDKNIQRGLVADFNNNAIGQLWLRLSFIDPAIEDGLAVAYVHTLVVLPEFRRLGVAEGLIRTASTIAADRGRTHLAIGVDRPNEAARRLYAKWEFERYYETFDLRGDLVFMRRSVFESDPV